LAIQYEIKSGVVILRVGTEGHTHLRDALCAARRDLAARPTMPLLFDLRGEAPNVRYEDARWRVEILAEMRLEFGPRWAFLTGTGPVRTGIGRMFATFSEIEGLDVGLFVDEAVALRWLAER
jgi:hypothetical protein